MATMHTDQAETEFVPVVTGANSDRTCRDQPALTGLLHGVVRTVIAIPAHLQPAVRGAHVKRLQMLVPQTGSGSDGRREPDAHGSGRPVLDSGDAGLSVPDQATPLLVSTTTATPAKPHFSFPRAVPLNCRAAAARPGRRTVEMTNRVPTIMAALSEFFRPEIRVLRGEMPLRIVFWGYGVVASSVIIVLYGTAVAMGQIIFQQLLLILASFYTAWILVGIWRCSPNADQFWGNLARWMTVAWALNSALIIIFLQLDLLVQYGQR